MSKTFTNLYLLTLFLFGMLSGGDAYAQRGDPNGHGSVSDFSIRTEENMGNWAYLNNDAALTASYKWTPLTSTVRRMAANFLVENDNTQVAITFSAEAWMENQDKSLYVRLLLDGQPMNPGDVLFADGTTPNARAFTFTQLVQEAGLHTVEVEWSASREARARIKDGSLLIRQANSNRFAAVTPPSGPVVQTNNLAWTAIPNMGSWVFVDDNQTLTASLSAESYVSNGGRMFVRALADGVPLMPGDMIFAEGKRPQSRRVTFGTKDVAPGWHWVEMQWLVDNAGVTASIGDRTLEVASLPNDDLKGLRSYFIAAPSGATIAQGSSTYQAVPDMSLFTSIPQNATVAVQFSAEMWSKSDADLQLQLVVGGTPVAGSEVEVTADGNPDTHSYVLEAKNLNVAGGGLITTIALEWRKQGGDRVYMGDRAMNILIKPGDEPDLAEPPVFSGGGVTLEPNRGERKVLTVLIDPQLPGTPAPIPANNMENFLYNNAQSIPDYYDEISNHRLNLSNVDTLGWYNLDFDSDHYWNANYDCSMGDTYTGGHAERWAEAVDKADMDFDFSAYDYNGDGLLDPRTELAVVIIVNQSGGGEGVYRPLNPYCSGNPVMADGVIIPEINESYLTGINTQWQVVAHEMAHLFFQMSDMYVANHAYDPGKLSLMSDLIVGSTPHLDAVHKLWLGWVEPTIVKTSGIYTLPDIRNGGEVLVLPRTDSDGREYYVLENRQDQMAGADYDVNIDANGIIVWHANDDLNVNNMAPNCVSQAFWNGVSVDSTRRGIRLVRPPLVFSNNNAGWDAADYDLSNVGLVCPGMGAATNILNWMDGTPSNYRISNWSMPGAVMDFTVDVF